MDRNAITEIVTQYMAAWNEPEAAARSALLERCWSDAGVYLDPGVSLAGRDALAVHIAKVQAARPGARLAFMSGIDVHHNVVRFLWRLVRADGTAATSRSILARSAPTAGWSRSSASSARPLRCRKRERYRPAFRSCPLPPPMS